MQLGVRSALRRIRFASFYSACRRAAASDLRFFLTWVRHPRQLGAILPSGKALSAAVAASIDADAPGAVVELGGGTGNVTKAILDSGVARGGLVVIEREAALCEVISKRFPDVRVLRANACNLETLLRRAGVTQVKTVVSGLPLLSLENEDCRRILDSAFSVLADDGELLQFTYGPASPVSRNIRASLGIEGKVSGWTLWNLPPAAVWRYRRKDSARGHRRAA